MRTAVLLSCVALLAPVAASAQAEASKAMQTAPLPDDVLALNRGRFVLPSGQELALTVRTDTSVNGQLLLRSVFAVDSGAPSLKVFAPLAALDGQVAQTAGPVVKAVSAPNVAVTIDAVSSMPTVRALAPVATSVTVGAAAEAPKPDEALTALPVTLGGPAVETANGTVRAVSTAAGTYVSLAGSTLNVGQLLGQSFASVIANTGSDRTIDTTTTIDLGLSNMTSTLVDSAMLRIAGLVDNAGRPPF